MAALPNAYRLKNARGNSNTASANGVFETRRNAALCLGTLTVKVEVAAAEPGVTGGGCEGVIGPGNFGPDEMLVFGKI